MTEQNAEGRPPVPRRDFFRAAGVGAASIAIGASTTGRQQRAAGAPGGAAGNRYVAVGGNDGNDGMTWASAFATVQKGINDLASSATASSRAGVVHVGGGTFVGDIMLKSAISVIGSGERATHLKATAGSSAPGAITMDAGPVIQLRLEDFTLVPNGNTNQHGIYLKSEPSTDEFHHGGMWWAQWRNLTIDGFGGHQIWLRGGGTSYLTPHQYIDMHQVKAFPNVTKRALYLTGQVGQINLHGGQFDLMNTTPTGGENIRLNREVNDSESVVSDVAPYSVNFYGVTTESNTYGIVIDRASPVLIDGCHFERLDYGVTVASAAELTTISNSDFQLVGVHAGGGGYIVSAGAACTVIADGNHIIGAHDRDFVAESAGTIVTRNNRREGSPVTSGLTHQLNAAGTLTLGSATTFLVNASSTTITSITSSLGPGESIWIKAFNGSIKFGTGGNVGLGGRASPRVIAAGTVIQLTRFDLGGTWEMVG